MYADIGPSSVGQSQPPASTSTLHLDLDEHRVEYAQLNHNAHRSNIADNSTNEGELSMQGPSMVEVIMNMGRLTTSIFPPQCV